MKPAHLMLVGLFGFVGGMQSTYADEQNDVHPYLTAKFSIDLGVYFPERETTFRVDGSLPGTSSNVDFQQELGAGKSDETFALNAGWRFGKNGNSSCSTSSLATRK